MNALIVSTCYPFSVVILKMGSFCLHHDTTDILILKWMVPLRQRPSKHMTMIFASRDLYSEAVMDSLATQQYSMRAATCKLAYAMRVGSRQLMLHAPRGHCHIDIIALLKLGILEVQALTFRTPECPRPDQERRMPLVQNWRRFGKPGRVASDSSLSHVAIRLGI
jgi:hypothetical protein